MQAPLQGFQGLMLLNPEAPAVILITYVNANETSDALTRRLMIEVPKVFGGDKGSEPQWTSTPIDINEGDRAGSGTLYAGTLGDRQLQLALFNRDWRGSTVVYGYFAMRNAKDKEKDVAKYWLDAKGRGIKPFEKFWKSFPAK